MYSPIILCWAMNLTLRERDREHSQKFTCKTCGSVSG